MRSDLVELCFKSLINEPISQRRCWSIQTFEEKPVDGISREYLSEGSYNECLANSPVDFVGSHDG